ncbi:LysR family transcriptional regulator [Trinickia acidisoli]|uniref:LysR family transcriptional regulator n=1 Tax=Trinickia acidisoli TaxID=2767482 RepID=UPI001A90B81A|nr:LysR family transcriptional regulator [Trinickia acidisoli]
MNTRDLEAFLAVVEAGSIMAASMRLHLTQSGVSRRIRALEETLGATLLDRQSKPLKPTLEGMRTYEHGRRILGVLDDLKSGFSSARESRGEFRVGITPCMPEIAMGTPLDRLRTEFSNLTTSVIVGGPDMLLEKLRRGEIDVAAVCSPESVDPTLEFDGLAIGVQRLVVVAPRSAVVASPATLHHLSSFDWVLSHDGCGIRSVVSRRFEREGIALRIGIEAMSSDLRLSLVARGLGLTVVNRRAFAESPLQTRLRDVEVADFEPCISSWLVHRPPSGRLVGPIRSFKEALVSAFAAAS